jgi:hypothetical protein
LVLDWGYVEIGGDGFGNNDIENSQKWESVKIDY